MLASLVCCAESEKHTLVAKDTGGNPIAGVEIWATYNSSNYAPKFVTDSKGSASIDIANDREFHSLSIYYNGFKLSLMGDGLKWPLELVVGKDGIQKK